jgi:hypothetical protein
MFIMNLRFQPHAVERMQQRNLTVGEVETVIASPDGRIRQSHDKWILYKRLGRKDDSIAAVVIEEMGQGIIDVVTVMVNFEVQK